MTNKAASFPFDQTIVWTPDESSLLDTNLGRFMKKHDLSTFPDLMSKSTSDIGWFWDSVIEDLDIQFEHPYSKVVDNTNGPEFPEWCVDGRMNIIHNLLDKWLENENTADRTALKYESEEGDIRYFSYREVAAEVARVAEALRADGFSQGDVIALFMPMTPELLFSFLAIIKIGAVILPLFSGYGPKAVTTRLQDAEAVALFTSDGFPRRGKTIGLKEVADEALESCPSVRRVIVHNRSNRKDVPFSAERDRDFENYVAGFPEISETTSTSAEDTMMIIYTSGTTGRPKGAVHTHCGFPIKGAQDMFHAMDLKPGETMYWMSDMGWMMGPWLVFGTMMIGASMVFTDGAPDYPDAGRLWEMVANHNVTHLGLSPVLIRALMPSGTEYVERSDLNSLRAVASTGSPWDPASWNWVFENVLEKKKPILNYSGGTEISGGILCGNFLQPLKPCSFSGPVPGMAVDVIDESGESVTGVVGELAIREPWIGMTRGFLNDRERYLQSYWSKFPGVWVHGDFAAVDDDGLYFILGRSDDTIKVAGKRLGPAEVESIVSAHPDVTESAAIGIPHDIKGEEVGIFVVLKAGATPNDELRADLVRQVMDELGKPLKPGFIRFATMLPKTRNAKVMRRVIQAVHLGNNPGDMSSLEDPASLAAILNAT